MVATFQRKRNQRISAVRIVKISVMGMLVGGILVVLFLANVRIIQKRADLRERGVELSEKIHTLEEQGNELRAEVLETQSEAYQERVLREKGLYKKPGEEVITILLPEQEESPADKQEEGFFKKFLDEIF